MADPENERIELLKSAGRVVGFSRVATVENLEPGDELLFEDGTSLVVDKIATLTCDGCGRQRKLPAEFMPAELPAVILCPRCMTNS